MEAVSMEKKGIKRPTVLRRSWKKPKKVRFDLPQDGSSEESDATYTPPPVISAAPAAVSTAATAAPTGMFSATAAPTTMFAATAAPTAVSTAATAAMFAAPAAEPAAVSAREEDEPTFIPLPPLDPPQPSDVRCMIELGDDMYVRAAFWRGEMKIHIREFITDEAKNKTYPTKKGIVLSLQHWLLLEENISNINRTIEMIKAGQQGVLLQIHLGSNKFIKLSDDYKTVDIRDYFVPDYAKPVQSDPIPTKRGVALNYYLWDKLVDVCQVLRDFVPELNTCVPCYMEEDHKNPDIMDKCQNCNPNGFDTWFKSCVDGFDAKRNWHQN